MRAFPDDPTLNLFIQSEKEVLEEGDPYRVFQMKLLAQIPQKRDPGTYASLIELIIESGGDDIPPDQQANLLRLRCESLRQLDETAQAKLNYFGESFRPKERIALQMALSEFERRKDDPYFRDAESLNLCASWAYLLHRFQDAIDYADAAIKLGGLEYINPFRNKALALSAQGNSEKSLEVFQEALSMAERQGEQAQELVIRGAMEEQRKVPPPGLAELRPKLEYVLRTAGDAAYHEITAGKGTLESMGGHFLKRLQKVGFDWSPAYVLVLAELLVFYSPEAAYFIIQKATMDVPTQTGNQVIGHLSIAAHYLSAYASGALRRDAARLRTLQLISFLDADLIIEVYLKQVRDISLEADPPLSEVASLIKDEMARIHPRLPHFLDDQPPMSADDRQRARSVISEVFSVRFEPANDNHVKPKQAGQVNMMNSSKPPHASQKSWFKKLFGR
jgi:tetratricopeptide (TPR) repeat protein